MVKLQVLNLSVKLYLTNPQQTELLCQYVFSLARYDENYDIRDRARFLKPFIFPVDANDTILSKNARKIFLASKPAPLLESKYHGREQYQLGSLSHYLNIRATGYHDLPTFPNEASDSSVRDTVVESDRNPNVSSEDLQRREHWNSNESSKGSSKKSKSSTSTAFGKGTDDAGRSKKNETKSFYSDSDKSSAESSSEEEDEESDDESGDSGEASESGQSAVEEGEDDDEGGSS